MRLVVVNLAARQVFFTTSTADREQAIKEAFLNAATLLDSEEGSKVTEDVEAYIDKGLPMEQFQKSVDVTGTHLFQLLHFNYAEEITSPEVQAWLLSHIKNGELEPVN